MWKRIKIAWRAYRHFAALKGLLEWLGAWKWGAPVVAVMGAKLLSLWLSIPIWWQISIGVVAFCALLEAAGFALFLWKVHKEGGIESLRDTRTQQEDKGPWVAIRWVSPNYYYANLGNDEAFSPTLTVTVRDLVVNCQPPPGNLRPDETCPVLVNPPYGGATQHLSEYMASLQGSAGVEGIQQWIDSGRHLTNMQVRISFQDRYGQPWETEWGVTGSYLEPGIHPIKSLGGGRK